MAGSDLLVGITPYEETKAVPGGRDPSFGMAGDGSFAALFSGLVREQASSQLAASVSGSRASAAGALQPARRPPPRCWPPCRTGRGLTRSSASCSCLC
jgi:hypothetical protein